MSALSAWVKSRNNVEGWDDRHIDQLDSRLQNRTTWVRGGPAILAEALGVVAKHECPCRIALVQQFSPASHYRAALVSEVAMTEALDYVPPSLYLASAGHEPWIASESDKRVVTHLISPVTLEAVWPHSRFACGLLVEYSATADEQPVTTLWVFRAETDVGSSSEEGKAEMEELR